MKPILCIGATPTAQRSMIFPTLTIDAVNRATEVYEYASGKSLNVARVLLVLGAMPIATGFLGGPRGEYCRKQLDEIGLHHDFVTVDAPTRLCTTVIDSATGTVTELVEESQAVALEKWAELDGKIESLLPGSGFVVFSGSLPPGAPGDLYNRWLAMAERAGVRPIIDARGEPLRQAMQRRGAIIKVNRDELAATLHADLSGGQSLIDAMRASLPPKGIIVITDGSDGAYASDGKTFVRIRPPKIKALNPVGSGDAFAAGLAAGLEAGQPLDDSCRLATAAAASNALSPRAGDVRKAEVVELLDQVQCQKFVARDNPT
jgi:tagatose 6-phosphate kinase